VLYSFFSLGMIPLQGKKRSEESETSNTTGKINVPKKRDEKPLGKKNNGGQNRI